MPRQIVKVQIPLATNDPLELCLIYDQHRAHVVHCTRKTTKAKMVELGVPKAFFYADWHDKSRKWNVHDRAPDQEW